MKNMCLFASFLWMIFASIIYAMGKENLGIFIFIFCILFYLFYLDEKIKELK